MTSSSEKSAQAASRAPRAGQLGRRLLKWSLLIAFVPMLVLAGQGYHCARAAVLDTAVERLTQLAASRKARLELWLSERLADVAFLGSCPHVQDGCRAASSHGNVRDAESTRNFLRAFATKFGNYEAIGVYDPSWRELASVGTEAHGLADFALSGIQEAVRSSRQPAVGQIHRHPDHRLGMHFGAPVLGAEQEPIGYVLTALDYVQAIKHILYDGDGRGAQLQCYLVSNDGLILTDPRGGNGVPALVGSVATVGFKRGLAGELGAAVYSDYRGRDVVGGFAAIPQMHWVLLIEQDAGEALSWLSRLAWRAAVSALLVAIGVVFFSFMAARRMAAPLQQLAAVANRVAAGVHDARVEPVAEPEVDAVGKALNHMLDQLAAARERLVHNAALAVMGEMSSAVVHEMRNPLSSIKLNVRALLLKLGGDVRHSELARIAEQQVERLERMLSDLLSLGKPLSMNVTPMMLQEAVADAMEAVANEARQRRCRLRLQDDAPGAKGLLDAERIRHALLNLLQNALDAIDDGGEVVVRTSLEGPEGKRALIEVLDDGPGIPEDNLDRLFKPFFTTRAHGTGLGLAIVRKIVECHGGRVYAANRAGSGDAQCGAVFRIELPHDDSPIARIA